MIEKTEAGADLSREELLRRARSLVRVLKERADRCEELRQCPPETIDDFAGSGLLVAGNPPRYGGYAADYDAVLEVIMELGRGCGSSAWCYAVWTVINWIVGHFPVRAQEEYFAGGPLTLSSSSYDPVKGTAVAADGGFRLSGHWDFSSGCDAATWFQPGATGPDGPMWLMVPRAECTMQDTWFVSGLAGTGSKDIVIEDVFVPEHRTADPARAGEHDLSGWELHGRPSYRVPLRVFLVWELIAPLVGIAQAAVDEFIEWVPKTVSRSRSAESVQMQMRLSEAAVEVHAARLLFRSTLAEIVAKAAALETYSEIERARYSRDKAFVVRLCLQAVNRLFEVSGGRSLYSKVPLQRLHRDANALAHRDGMILDFAGVDWGRLSFENGTQ